MQNTGLMPVAPRERLSLPQVTLCAVSSTNVAATIRAMEATLTHISFSDAILFTDVEVGEEDCASTGEIRVVRIDRIESAEAYSRFMLTQLVGHIQTSHCLTVQWDGHVIDAARWRPEFLAYDYVGARWPQFDDGHVVGNGGFSLRSRRLMEACRSHDFKGHHPEDVAICRTNRVLLEQEGLKFAPAELADQFAAERAGDPASSFGYHGVFHMPQVLGVDEFWKVYLTLDERSSLGRDFKVLLSALQKSPNSGLRSLRMIGIRIVDLVSNLVK
jgi:hypothetical protein